MTSAARLAKLKIIAFTDPGFKKKATEFDAMINPQDITLKEGINYEQAESIGKSEAEPKYKSHKGSTLDFELTIDGTGVVTGVMDNVEDKLKKLREVTLNFDGSIHQPRYVRISWGEVLFDGRCISLSTKYTLFKPDGAPLRATATLSFTSFMDSETAAKLEKKSSPDLTHVRSVRAGDTLPLLCEQIYNDSSKYLQVARVNGLVDFRNLEPGTEIHFPPLKK